MHLEEIIKKKLRLISVLLNELPIQAGNRFSKNNWMLKTAIDEWLTVYKKLMEEYTEFIKK